MGKNYKEEFKMIKKSLTKSDKILDFGGEFAGNLITGGYNTTVGTIDIIKNSKDKSFDVITCVSVLEYINERQEMIDEFHRILNGQGLLFLGIYLDSEVFTDKNQVLDLCEPQFNLLSLISSEEGKWNKYLFIKK